MKKNKELTKAFGQRWREACSIYGRITGKKPESTELSRQRNQALLDKIDRDVNSGGQNNELQTIINTAHSNGEE